MSAKSKNVKPTTRQKKLIHTIAAQGDRVDGSVDLNTLEGKEAAIVRQFNQIQKDYARLMNDVRKELSLVRGWLGSQAMTKREEIRTMLNARMSRT